MNRLKGSMGGIELEGVGKTLHMGKEEVWLFIHAGLKVAWDVSYSITRVQAAGSTLMQHLQATRPHGHRLHGCTCTSPAGCR
jgi:hypothetical protein